MSGPATCLSCGGDLPYEQGPLCSEACRRAYWGPDISGDPADPYGELVNCHACEVPAEVCRAGWNVVHRRCCTNCDHGPGEGWRAAGSYVAGLDAALRAGFDIHQARALNGGPDVWEPDL